MIRIRMERNGWLHVFLAYHHTEAEEIVQKKENEGYELVYKECV